VERYIEKKERLKDKMKEVGGNRRCKGKNYEGEGWDIKELVEEIWLNRDNWFNKEKRKKRKGKDWVRERIDKKKRKKVGLGC